MRQELDDGFGVEEAAARGEADLAGFPFQDAGGDEP
jgi:hypothetical protein